MEKSSREGVTKKSSREGVTEKSSREVEEKVGGLMDELMVQNP